MAFREGFLKARWGRGQQIHDHLMYILLIGWKQGNWGQHYQLSSTWLGINMFVVKVNFFYKVGVLVSTKQLKDMAQDIIYSPWGGTKGTWLCFKAKLLLFFPAWLFFFVSAFSHFSDWFWAVKLREGLRTLVFLQTRGSSHVGLFQKGLCRVLFSLIRKVALEN